MAAFPGPFIPKPHSRYIRCGRGRPQRWRRSCRPSSTPARTSPISRDPSARMAALCRAIAHGPGRQPWPPETQTAGSAQLAAKCPIANAGRAEARITARAAMTTIRRLRRAPTRFVIGASTPPTGAQFRRLAKRFVGPRGGLVSCGQIRRPNRQPFANSDSTSDAMGRYPSRRRRGPRRCTRPIRRAPAPAEGAPTRRERPPPVSETRRAPRDHGAAYVEHPARDCLPAMSAGPGPANRPKSPLTERSANGRRGSWSEVEFDAVAGWLDAGVVVEAGGVGASEVSDDVGEFGEGVEFLVEGVEASGGLGVVGLVPSGVEVVDGLVEAAGFGGDGPGVGGFGGGFLVGPVGGFFAPVAA